MAGSHHSARQPTRLSSIGKRTPRAVNDRRRVSEADFRRAIYVRPLGLGYHVVKNICNDQEYVVADATNSTFKAGVVVSLGSFTGNPGEFVLGKPPAGFGGASSFSIQRASAGYGLGTNPTAPVPDTESWVEGGAWCFGQKDSCGVSAGFYQRTYDGDPTARYFVGIQLHPRSSFPVPVANEGDGERAGEVEVGSTPNDVILVAEDGSGNRAALYRLFESGGVNDSMRYRWASFTNSGDLSAEGDYLGPDYWSENMDWCISGGKVFCVEPREADDSFSGPPYSSGVRVTVRSLLSLEVQQSYDFPSVTPFQGSGSRGQWPLSINASLDGGVYVHFYNISSTFVTTYWRRKLSASLTAVGSDESVSWGTSYFIGGGHCYRRLSSSLMALGKKTSGSEDDLWEHDGLAFVSDYSLDLDPNPDNWLERGVGDEVIVRDSSYIYRAY